MGMRKVQLGSISTGTLRTEDLLDAVIGEVDYLFGLNGDYLASHGDDEWIGKPLRIAKAITDFDSDDAGYALDELIDALNEYAPPHVHFGAHEGDGADYGWWPTGFDGCDTVQVDEGSNGEGTFVDTDCNLYVEVNDHGNMTVKALGGEVIWDCV
jgi:hypothetical protein